jgi:predicted ferric reductase
MRALHRLVIPGAIIAITTAIVVWAFPRDLAPARTLGIALGWIGVSLLLCSLLLMLRERRLAHWLGGLERMYEWHHWSGVAAYVVLLVHPIVLAANAWPSQPVVAWQTISPFSESWPVWSGWLSLVLLMAGLAATFEKRLPYRARRWLHIALGAGVLCGVAHLFLLGIDEPEEPFLAAAVLLLGWRAIREDWGLGSSPYVVDSVRPVAAGTVEIGLMPLDDPVPAVPGQFVLVAFHGGRPLRGCGEFHPFTVSFVRADGLLRIAVKAAGDSTRRLQSLTPGVVARVQGAFGTLFDGTRNLPELWVAGGIGITPFLALLRAGHVTQPTTLLYLYRTHADAAFLQELQAMAGADPNLTVQAVSTAEGPRAIATLLPDADRLSGRECYVCGPPRMIEGVRRALRARGVTPRQIHAEHMQSL